MTQRNKNSIAALFSVSFFLFSTIANSQIADTSYAHRNFKNLDFIWEIGIGETYFANSNVLTNSLNVEGHPTSFQYYVSARIGLDKKREVSKFYLNAGIGPNVKTFGLDKTIEVIDEKLRFSDFQIGNRLNYSIFQQCFLDFPFAITYQTRQNKKGRSISVEGGGVFGIQVYNRWKTSETIEKIKTIRSEEGLPQINPLHYGSSIKIGTNKKRGAISTGYFISCTYFFSNVFVAASNTVTQSYTFRIGMTISANDLLSKQ